MTVCEKSIIDNRVALLEAKLSNVCPNIMPETFLGDANVLINIVIDGVINFKNDMEIKHEEYPFAYFAKHISRLEDFFTIISRP